MGRQKGIRGQAERRAELDRQNRTGRRRLPGKECQDRTDRTRLPGQGCQDRAARTGLSRQD
jgi:hypothetical protein